MASPSTASEKKSEASQEVLLHSRDSERLLLCAVLDPDRRRFATGLLPRHAPEDFFLEQHAFLWKACSGLADNSLDFSPVAVIDHCRRMGWFVGGTEYVLDLADDALGRAASDDSINAASGRIKELALARNLEERLLQGLKLCRQAGQPPEQVLALVEDDLMNLRRTSESARAGPSHVREGINMVLDRVAAVMDGAEIEMGVTTGSDELDNLISGLVDEDMIVVGARPSMGKTAALLSLARAGASKGRTALIFSLEMKQAALVQRLLASEARINGTDLRSGRIHDSDISRLFDGARALESQEIWIDDTPGLTLQEIRSRARTFVATHGKATIFVDYLQHVGKRDGDDEKSHASSVSGGLKLLARELKCPIVVLSQLNRTLESRANRRPILSDLRESGAIEQDADIIIFLYRDEVYNPDTKEPGISEWIVAKQRDGPIGTVKRAFTGPTGRFDDIGTDTY